MQSTSSIKSASRWQALFCAAFVSTGFGAKLWIISHYANPTPFWDEWDGQAANLFVPYFDSTLSLEQLLAAHNEHRLLTMRIVSLVLIIGNGLWDPILQMIVNAAIHVTLGLSILLFFRKHLDQYAFAALAVITTILVAIPNAWENPLMSFQTSFYLVLLFGFTAIHLITRESGFSSRRVIGVFAATLSFLSLASGALVFLACATVVIAKRIFGIESGWREWTFAAVLLLCAILALLVTPTIEGHKWLAAHSFVEFGRAFFTVAGWPLPRFIVGAVVVNTPWLIFTWRAIRKPPSSNSIAWAILGIGIWNGLQFASLAFGRAVGIGASRYLDICAFGLIINFACAVILSDTERKKRWLVGWVAVVAIGFIIQTATYLPQQLQNRYSTAIQEEKNIKAFLATGEFLPGASGKDLSLPYPDAKRLAGLLSDARVRRFLPSNLQSVIVGEGLARQNRLGVIRDALLLTGPYLAIAGLLLLLLLVVRTQAFSTVARAPIGLRVKRNHHSENKSGDDPG